MKMQPSLYASQLKDASSDFTQDDLIKYWIEYANSLPKVKSHLRNTLNSCKPVLKENFEFEVAIYNPSQKDELMGCHASIVGFLSDKLKNSRIIMDIQIVEKDETKMIYTQREKFTYLSEKNPNVEKLMEMFNLTIE